jgi:asparagine synthase (glutamine-hydrolysing)
MPVSFILLLFGGNTGGYLDERGYVRLVADRYGTDHAEYEVIPALEELVEKIVHAYDEPFADDSAIPSYFVCEIARRKVTVALSGLGGDEACYAQRQGYLKVG